MTEEVRLPGQLYGARQDKSGQWHGFCLTCPLTGKDMASMQDAWDDAESHWRNVHQTA